VLQGTLLGQPEPAEALAFSVSVTQKEGEKRKLPRLDAASKMELACWDMPGCGTLGPCLMPFSELPFSWGWIPRELPRSYPTSPTSNRISKPNAMPPQY